MFKTTLIILLLALIILVIFYYFKIKNKDKGRSRVHMKMQEKKEMNKDRIMRLFEKKERVQSVDVQSTLLIEESETNEYLEELEKDGEIKKLGEGIKIYYTKVVTEKKK